MTNLPYESFTIMDLYCSVHDMFQEENSHEKRRSERRMRHRRRKSSGEVETTASRTSLTRRSSVTRKKSSSASVKAALRIMAQPALAGRRLSSTAPSLLSEGAQADTQERRSSQSQKKFSNTEAGRRDSLVNYLQGLEIDTISILTSSKTIH